jgi:hypothetical protein
LNITPVPREKMAKVVEQEMSENVGNLNTYIKDTTDIPQKLNNISQPQPNETIMFCLDAKVLLLIHRFNRFLNFIFNFCGYIFINFSISIFSISIVVFQFIIYFIVIVISI